jgi:excinuclease ABC subunit A
VARAVSEAGDGPHAGVACDTLTMHARFQGVVTVGAGMVSSSPWSNPATQTGCFEAIRAVFAGTPEAAALGLRQQDFSTSSPGGRCEACEGLGQTRVSMDFLPDVRVTCENCGGACFSPPVLSCLVGGRSVAGVLALTVDEARTWAAGLAEGPTALMLSALDALREVGLGYVRLGQPTRRLSGGERQRLALAAALLQRAQGRMLYLFDEPTTGLHADDVERLLTVFDRLIDAGHTLVVIEHNLDLIARADWVIDLGPEGGPAGGRLVAAGTPEAIAANPSSRTGIALAAALAPPPTGPAACS